MTGRNDNERRPAPAGRPEAGAPSAARPAAEGFLAAMVDASRRRAEQARCEPPLGRPDPAPPAGRLIDALRGPAKGRTHDVAHRRLAVIAEIKRASPSRGPLAPGLDAAARARAYERAGAAAVSVLTEPDYFRGSLDDLRAVTAAVSIPVLRKDFVVDPCQVREAASAGAAGVLLIAAALDDHGLRTLLRECLACGLDALVECHDETDVHRALDAGATLVGINNRDLTTLSVDLATTEALAALVPAHVTLVAESGIRDAVSAERMLTAGADAILVGEALVSRPAAELAAAVSELALPGGAPSATGPTGPGGAPSTTGPTGPGGAASADHRSQS